MFLVILNIYYPLIICFHKIFYALCIIIDKQYHFVYYLSIYILLVNYQVIIQGTGRVIF